jgi:hypothetical protein
MSRISQDASPVGEPIGKRFPHVHATLEACGPVEACETKPTPTPDKPLRAASATQVLFAAWLHAPELHCDQPFAHDQRIMEKAVANHRPATASCFWRVDVFHIMPASPHEC